MKHCMKHLLAFLTLLLCFTLQLQAKSDDHVKYDIQSAGSGTQGTCLVKVYVYSSSAKDDQLKYAAVHGVLFRGYKGTPSAPPLAGSATVETQQADYFKAFFSKEKTYQQYASVVPGSYERIKMAKGGYKIGAVVQVNKDQLRTDLQAAGIIRGLSSGF